MKLIITLVVCSTLAFFGYHGVSAAEGESGGIEETSLHTVQRRDLRITVTENGYLKAENSLKMKPKFERQGRITWLVEEGKEVEEDERMTSVKEEVSMLSEEVSDFDMDGTCEADI